MSFWVQRTVFGMIVGVLVALVGMASARGAESVRNDLLGPVAAYTQLCQAQPDACALDSHKLAFAGEARLRQLAQVNAQVNRSILPVKDTDHWGVTDRWTWPAEDGLGDCEEFVLEKRHQLRELGWPISALVITVVITPAGESHAVLVVRTTRGDFVLDNLTNDIRSPRDTGHVFIKRPVPGAPLLWTSWDYQ